jgi:hypothetical protein
MRMNWVANSGHGYLGSSVLSWLFRGVIRTQTVIGDKMRKVGPQTYLTTFSRQSLAHAVNG